LDESRFVSSIFGHSFLINVYIYLLINKYIPKKRGSKTLHRHDRISFLFLETQKLR
jgi:hypothetical protein